MLKIPFCLGAVLSLSINMSYAVSADDFMSNQVDKLFESKQYVFSTDIMQDESRVVVARRIVNKKNYDSNAVQIPGLGTIRNGVYDVNDATHVIFYTDGVVFKLDY